MPDLDAPLLLDLLFGLIILLFVPFGIRRGVAKEAMGSAGLLFGSVLTAAWGGTAVRWLIDVLGMESALARFAIDLAGFAGGMIFFGYLGGAALGRLHQGVLARIAGGFLAAANGTFFLVSLFNAIERHLQPGTWLNDGIVARTLLREDNWITLGIAALVVALILVGLLVTTGRRRRQPRASAFDPAAAVPARQRPVRLAREDDPGKYEPTPDSRPGRFGGNVSLTAPLTTGSKPSPSPSPSTAAALGSPWARERLDLPANTNGHGLGHGSSPRESATVPIADAWVRRSDSGRTVDASAPTPASSAASRRCPRCGAPSRTTDVFCPECGQTV